VFTDHQSKMKKRTMTKINIDKRARDKKIMKSGVEGKREARRN